MKKITVVGGMNVDIEGNPYGQINHGASNPGTLAMSFSGTGLDIAKNLALLGDKVVFAGLAGDDSPGKMGKVELAELGVDVSKMKFVPEH
ncbi:MAG: PfkB family carbohydrate kinase, partial [Anaerovoracaceae bacterium]